MTERASSTITKDRVENLVTAHGEPDWLKLLRLSAWELYSQKPMPTSRDEMWRRTEIDALDIDKLKATDVIAKSSAAKNSPEWLQPLLTAFENKALVAGAYSTGVSEPELPETLTKQGVIFCSLPQALKKHTEQLRKHLETMDVCEEEEKFTLLNKALFDGGIFLYVPKNVNIEVPLITAIEFGGKNASLNTNFPRVIAILEANSSATLVNVIASEGQDSTGKPDFSAAAFSSALVELTIADNAKLKYVEVQKFDSSVFAVSKTSSKLGRDAELVSYTAGLGGGQIKCDISTVLSAPGAHSDVQGVVLGEHHEHFSYNTIQHHDAPNTTSNINFRTALKDSSTSVYQGIIRVAKEAQKTEAFQSNKNLLIGNDARADSIPKLEILADDVKCSHGATVGPVDKEQVFYLMSRGLDRLEAEELIVTGFFRQVLESCPVTGAVEWINQLVTQKVHGA